MYKTKRVPVIGMALLGAALLMVALDISTTTQARPATQVGPWSAMKAATDKVGGKAWSATYAQEGGKWLYDVIVIKDKKLVEVEVDATTGKVGDSESATPAGEGQELTAELSKAIGQPTKAADKEEADEKNEKPTR